jgi:hypothetical protein
VPSRGAGLGPGWRWKAVSMLFALANRLPVALSTKDLSGSTVKAAEPIKPCHECCPAGLIATAASTR